MGKSLAEKVQAGIDWLDSFKPRWRRLVVPELLDMRSSFNCILGQVFATQDKWISSTGQKMQGCNGFSAAMSGVRGNRGQYRRLSEKDIGSLGFESAAFPKALQAEWKRRLVEV